MPHITPKDQPLCSCLYTQDRLRAWVKALRNVCFPAAGSQKQRLCHTPNQIRKLQQGPKSTYQHHCKQDLRSGRFRKQNLLSAAMLNTSSPDFLVAFLCADTNNDSELCTGYTLSMPGEGLKIIGRCVVCQGQQHVAIFFKTKAMSCSVCGWRHLIATCN